MSSGTELVKAGRPSQKSSVQRHLSVLVSVGVLIVFLTYVVVSQQFAFRIPYGNEIFASISCIIRSASTYICSACMVFLHPSYKAAAAST
jgi:hypothetical protein